LVVLYLILLKNNVQFAGVALEVKLKLTIGRLLFVIVLFNVAFILTVGAAQTSGIKHSESNKANTTNETMDIIFELLMGY